MKNSKINLPEYFRHIMELETEIYCKNKIIDTADKMTAELPPKPQKPRIVKGAKQSCLEREWKEPSCPKDPKEYMHPPAAPDDLGEMLLASIGGVILSAFVAFVIACLHWLTDCFFHLFEKSHVDFWPIFLITAGSISAIILTYLIVKNIIDRIQYKKSKPMYDEAYANALKKYEEEKEKYDVECSHHNDALAKAKKEDEDAINCKYANEVKLWKKKCNTIEASVSVAKTEAKKLSKPTREAEQTLQKLYDFNIIYPKYRNMVAVCTICEYLESGRCTELEGPNGAYNLYEAELRQNLIIGQLENVITNLQIIQNNQFQLYKKMDSIEKVLVSVDQKLNNVVKHAATISANINTIKDYTSDIAKSAQVTALASVVTAQYAEITARNTEAIKYISLIN